MHITKETVRKLLSPVLDTAAAVASFTPGDADDKLVAVLKRVSTSDDAMDYLAALLDRLSHKLLPAAEEEAQPNVLALLKQTNSEMSEVA